MACHGFCHAIDEFVACAQELVPEHGWGAEFGVVPCVASHVVAPFAVVAVVGMHDVAIVEESVPVVAVYLVVVEFHQGVDGEFYKAVAWVFDGGQTPDAEGAFAVEVFGCADELGIGFDTAVDADGDGCGATYSPCCAHAWLHVFVGCFEGVGDGVVVGEVEGLCLWGVDAEYDGGCVATYAFDGE